MPPLKDYLWFVSIFLKYHPLLQEKGEEDEECLWKVEECAQPKLMNLFGYKGELKAMLSTLRHFIISQNKRVCISL